MLCNTPANSFFDFWLWPEGTNKWLIDFQLLRELPSVFLTTPRIAGKTMYQHIAMICPLRK
jgi:hypothetical protein